MPKAASGRGVSRPSASPALARWCGEVGAEAFTEYSHNGFLLAVISSMESTLRIWDFWSLAQPAENSQPYGTNVHDGEFRIVCSVSPTAAVRKTTASLEAGKWDGRGGRWR